MKIENYVKVTFQNNLPTTGEIPEKSLNDNELQKCRKILQQDGEKYTDEEIQIIYNYLSEMAEISVSEYLKTCNHEESDFNVKGEFR